MEITPEVGFSFDFTAKSQQMRTNYSPFLGFHMILGTNKQTLKLLKLQNMKIETRNNMPRCIVQKYENISKIFFKKPKNNIFFKKIF